VDVRVIGVKFPARARELSVLQNVDTGSTQRPVQWVPEAPFPGVKELECEADHSLASSFEVKNKWNNISFSYIPL
jgi:hypothetical protein